MSASPFDHPFLSGLLGDDEIAGLLSAKADIRAMLDFEAALARAQARHGLVPEAAAARIADVCATFQPDMASLTTGTARDGVVVPALVAQLRKAVGPSFGDHVHFGATSQDVIDTSLMLRLKTIMDIIAGRLSGLVAALDQLHATFGLCTLMGRTRMQAAIPITVADRLAAWRLPLEDYRSRVQNQTLPLQFGGAAGTLDSLGEKAADVRATLAAELDLMDTVQWQSQRTVIADIAHLMALITGSLGKIGQDIALMAQSGDEITLAGGGTSSAMAHKQNPVAAEVLVTLARFNAVQISAIHQSMIHEQERSGAAWTVEWMVLPQMIMATGASLRLAVELTASIRRLGR